MMRKAISVATVLLMAGGAWAFEAELRVAEEMQARTPNEALSKIESFARTVKNVISEIEERVRLGKLNTTSEVRGVRITTDTDLVGSARVEVIEDRVSDGDLAKVVMVEFQPDSWSNLRRQLRDELLAVLGEEPVRSHPYPHHIGGHTYPHNVP